MSEPRPTEALKGPVRIRPATELDVNFIFDSWLRSYRSSKCTWGIRNPVYYGAQHRLMEGLCKRATVLVACNHEDASQLYGYVVAEMVDGCLVVHYAYTKESYRYLGVCTALLGQLGFDRNKPTFYTHRTANCERLEKRFPIVYNPYLSYSAYGQGTEYGKMPTDIKDEA